MRACIQRVSQAQVEVDRTIVGQIDKGLVVLLGVAIDDGPDEVTWMVDKIVGLRIFDDVEGKMNLGLADVDGALLVVSQFTLLGDCRKGRRPSFLAAAPPELAERLYDHFVAQLRAAGIRVETGRFRTQMSVALVNDGPVTLIVESPAPVTGR